MTADRTLTAVPLVLLVRHAQASFGTEDYDVLSDRGREQVGALADAFAARGIRTDRVVSGSLRRQRDTAVPWPHATVDDRWNEYDDASVLTHHAQTTAGLSRSADAPALSSTEFQRLLDAALSGWVGAGADGPGQTWPAFRDGAVAGLDALTEDLGRGETAMAVTSGGVIAALAAHLLGLADDAFVALNRVSVNTGVTRVVVGRQGRSLVTFNEHTHLEAGGLVTYR